MHLHGDLFSWHSGASWVAAGLMLLAYVCGRIEGKRKRK